MPLSIEVCLCILLCAASALLLVLVLYFVELTLWNIERRNEEIERNLRDKETAHFRNPQHEEPQKEYFLCSYCKYKKTGTPDGDCIFAGLCCFGIKEETEKLSSNQTKNTTE